MCRVFYVVWLDRRKRSLQDELSVFQCDSRKVQPLRVLTSDSCTRPYLLIVEQSCLGGKHVPNTKVSDLIYMIFWRQAPATLVLTVYCLHYPIIQEFQACQSILWPKSHRGCKVASEKQLYKSQKTITDIQQDFFKVKALLENNYSVLMFTLDTVALIDFYNTCEFPIVSGVSHW